MYAKKENKVYKVDEQNKKSYLAQGYDIFDDKHKLIEKSPKSTVSYEAYAKLQAELKKLKSGKSTVKATVKGGK